jgi:hypothetical protein
LVGANDLVDYVGFKGSPVRTLEETDPYVRGKKIVLRAMLFSIAFFVIFLYYMAFFYSRDEPFFQAVYLIMMIVLVVLTLGMFLFFQSLFARNWKRILIYDSGVEFPSFLWDRLRGREAFLPKADIVSVNAVIIVGPNVVGSNTGNLIFRTSSGQTYRTGDRIRSDIISTSDWFESNWRMRVDRTDLRGNPVAVPRDVLDTRHVGARTCIGCGYSIGEAFDSCPSCGRAVSAGTDPIIPHSTARIDEKFPAPVQTQARSYEYMQPQPSEQKQHGPAYQYGPEAAPQPTPYAPAHPDTYQAPEHPAPPPSYPGHHPYLYQQPPDPHAKNPRMAIIMAAVFGLLGMMGIGHLYMRKYIKGTVLLVFGAFFALVSLVSVIMIFAPDQYSVWVHIVTAAVMSAPFLLLYAWQVFDAPRPKRYKVAKEMFSYRPPNGP